MKTIFKERERKEKKKITKKEENSQTISKALKIKAKLLYIVKLLYINFFHIFTYILYSLKYFYFKSQSSTFYISPTFKF